MCHIATNQIKNSTLMGIELILVCGNWFVHDGDKEVY